MRPSPRALKILAVICAFLFIGVFVLPRSWKEKIPVVRVQNYLLARKANFGLDLVGGRQIDYVVDMTKVNEFNSDTITDNDRNPDDVVENVANILRSRIDPQGTRELNIYPAKYGEERHVIVEITNDLDNEDTLQKLDKVIDLAFKEQDTRAPKETDLAALKTAAQEELKVVTTENFTVQGSKLASDNKAKFNGEVKYWKEDLKNGLDQTTADEIWKAAPGTLFPKVFERKTNSVVQGADGNFQIQPNTEYVLLKTVSKEVADHTKTDPGEDFAKVQKASSSKPDLLKQKLLEVPEPFQSKILNLEPEKISDVLESDTEYAFFKILPQEANEVETSVAGVYVSKSTPDARKKIDEAHARVQEKTTTTREDQLTVQEITFSSEASPWKDTGLGGIQFKRARVGQDPNTGQPLVEILFNDEGAKLFADLTERNVGKPLAIFVGGELISAPTIQQKISGGSAVITLGRANYADAQKEAIRLAQELNGGSTPAPFQEKGQFKIGATLGTAGLTKSLRAGAIGLAILSIWMIILYRYLGFLAVMALGFYAVFILFLLQANLSFGAASLLGVIVFTVSMREFSSLEKNDLVALFIALILGVMVTFIAHSPIVLTLAGVAGIVLSMGMAVDANILIFERVKEEIRKGKNFSAASAIGFERAWSSIRDSNLSSLITCMILWAFGSAVIKGFAVALAMGIVISMITAITVTRTFIETLITNRMAKRKGFLIAEEK